MKRQKISFSGYGQTQAMPKAVFVASIISVLTMVMAVAVLCIAMVLNMAEIEREVEWLETGTVAMAIMAIVTFGAWMVAIVQRRLSR